MWLTAGKWLLSGFLKYWKVILLAAVLAYAEYRVYSWGYDSANAKWEAKEAKAAIAAAKLAEKEKAAALVRERAAAKRNRDAAKLAAEGEASAQAELRKAVPDDAACRIDSASARVLNAAGKADSLHAE